MCIRSDRRPVIFNTHTNLFTKSISSLFNLKSNNYKKKSDIRKKENKTTTTMTVIMMMMTMLVDNGHNHKKHENIDNDNGWRHNSKYVFASAGDLFCLIHIQSQSMLLLLHKKRHSTDVDTTINVDPFRQVSCPIKYTYNCSRKINLVFSLQFKIK